MATEGNMEVVLEEKKKTYLKKVMTSKNEVMWLVLQCLVL